MFILKVFLMLCKFKFMSDILFSTIEKFHSNRAWGHVLDAGTGLHSIKWLQSIQSTSWKAITADQNMKNEIEKDSQVLRYMRPSDEIIVGNWMDNSFIHKLGTYDTILADYLIGAVEGFSPYQQDEIIVKLKKHLNPDGRLYIIGMNPIPDNPVTESALIISEIRRARDSCILLAGHRPYREFPLDWMTRHLIKAEFQVIGSKNFTILHSEESAMRQIKVAQSKLSVMKNKELREGMEKYLIDLQNRLIIAVKDAGGRIPSSFDYVIAVEHGNCLSQHSNHIHVAQIDGSTISEKYQMNEENNISDTIYTNITKNSSI